MLHFLHSMFIRDWKLKFFAFLLAIAVFVIVRSDKDTEGSLFVNIEYINKPQKKIILNESNLITSVKIVIRGPWTLIRKLDNTQWKNKLVVDLSKVYDDRFELNASMFKFPRQIRFYSVTPSYLPIKMEAKLTRTVPVILNKSKFSRFFKVIEVKVIPDKLKLTGPKSDLLSILSIPLPSQEITRSGIIEKKIPVPTLLSSIQITPPIKKIAIRLLVEKVKTTKTFNDIPILIDGDTSNLMIQPANVNISITGDKKTLFSLPPSSLKPIVKVSNLGKKAQKSVTVTLKKTMDGFKYKIIPPFVTVKRQKPKTIHEIKAP